MIFLQMDMSQAEARIVYALSHDDELISLARKQPWEFDTHKYIASIIFGKPEHEISKLERYATKKVTHGCHHPDTEVLTPSGWIKIADIRDTDLIALWDINTRTIHFERPSKRFEYDFHGNLHLWDAQSFSQLVTPCHKMPHFTNGLGKTISSDKLTGLSSVRLPTSGLYERANDEFTEDFGRILAAIQADGSFQSNTSIRFHFRKQRKLDRLVCLSNKLKLRVTTTRRGNELYATIHGFPEAKEWLPGKRFSAKLLYLGKAALDGLLDELKYWDGNLQESHHHRKECFCTSIKENAEWVQTIAHLRGKGSQLNPEPKTSGFGSKIYTASINHRQFARCPNLLLIPYNGPVYCFETSTGFFLVRRNGKISVSGNSHYGMQDETMSDSLLREGFIFSPQECATRREAYMKRFPAIRDGYQYRSRMEYIQHKYLENSWGRRIYFEHERFGPELNRRIYAWRPQSEVGTTLNQWGLIPVFNFINKYNFKSRINLQVHDELAISTTPENDECWDLMRMLRESMERPREYEGIGLSIPVEFSLNIRYHSGEVEWKKFPSYDEYCYGINKLWENRIK